MMELVGVSVHELRVYEAVKGAREWITADEVAMAAGVAPRTARAHCPKLARLGIFDKISGVGGHRYRMSKTIDTVGMEYLERIERTKAVFSGQDAEP